MIEGDGEVWRSWSMEARTLYQVQDVCGAGFWALAPALAALRF